MKQILIIGAGRSTTSLIQYLEVQSQKYGWEITVGDMDINLVKEKVAPATRSIAFDVFNQEQLEAETMRADLVISMLPASFHPRVAKSCLKYSKSLFTASYESEDVIKMADEVVKKGILFLNEMGLDPGIDHMTAMQIIDRIKEDGHLLTGFESFTGGLVAPESDNNPWHYKFSWNPMNVVLAGQQGPAIFVQEGHYKYIPYNRLFRRTELIDIDGFGRFEGYANRNSLIYINKYNLQGISTIYRGTLRRPGFSKAWNIFVQLGATDNSYIMKDTENMTNKEFINSFLPYSKHDSVQTKLYHAMHIDQDSDIIDKLEWLAIFSDEKSGLKNATPAQMLQHILSKKWQLEPEDKDMIVMWHKISYLEMETKLLKNLSSSLVVTGENSIHTAMSKTVGLPLAIAAKLYLTGELRMSGVHIPTTRAIYKPILRELEEFSIRTSEKEL